MNLERVLCVPTEEIDRLAPDVNVAIPYGHVDRTKYANEVYVERDRGDGTGCEFDESLQQIIPYVVVLNQGRILCYQRKGGGEKRLDAKLSIGIGGHINDGDESYEAGVQRELMEELALPGFYRFHELRTLAFIRETESAVGRVHTGKLHVLDVGYEVPPTESPVYSYVHPEILKGHPRLERWSQIAIDILYGS